MYDLLSSITERRATAEDLALLEELCDLVRGHEPVRAGTDSARIR